MISQLIQTVYSGARSNKYRITIPVIETEFSRKFDFMVQSSTFPSKTITPVEVIIKGRKVQIRGETNIENTWDLTFYNTNDMEARNLLLGWMDIVHKNQWEPEGKQTKIEDAIDFVKGVGKGITNIIENPLSLIDDGVVSYQKNIIVEQLSHDGSVTFTTELIGAFPINISAIEISDSNSEISQTTVTFAFTDLFYEMKGERIDLDDIDKLF